MNAIKRLTLAICLIPTICQATNSHEHPATCFGLGKGKQPQYTWQFNQSKHRKNLCQPHWSFQCLCNSNRHQKKCMEVKFKKANKFTLVRCQNKQYPKCHYHKNQGTILTCPGD